MIVRSIITIAAFASLGAVSANAAPKGGAGDTAAGHAGWTKSESANENACFGQSRAWWASTLGQGTNPSYPAGTTNGDVISQRAQNGTNHASNDSFIEDYCDLIEAGF